MVLFSKIFFHLYYCLYIVYLCAYEVWILKSKEMRRVFHNVLAAFCGSLVQFVSAAGQSTSERCPDTE